MDFKTLSKPLGIKPNLTPVDVTKNQKSKKSKGLRFNQIFKKVHLVETYFRDIYSNRQINRWKRIVNRFVGILN